MGIGPGVSREPVRNCECTVHFIIRSKHECGHAHVCWDPLHERCGPASVALKSEPV